MALRFFIKIFISAVSVDSVQGFRRNVFLQIAVRAKVPTNAAPMVGTVRFPWGCLCFLLKSAGRAHLRIPPECRTEKPYNPCGFEDSLDAQKRRRP